MHDENATGNEFFKCDYCRSAWSEDRPMVEGHRGSLLCVKCLTLAYRALVLEEGGEGMREGETCALCLEHREELAWRSPLREEAVACRRCVKQSAGVLHKDRDIAWTKPTG